LERLASCLVLLAIAASETSGLSSVVAASSLARESSLAIVELQGRPKHHGTMLFF
jgi:hypothetical protein